MCNLYSVTKGQSAIRDLFRASRDRVGNLPLLPAIFPDQMAPIVRVGADGERELVMARWGMPGPPQYGGQPVTNLRNLGSPHWRGWLGNRNRCVVPATSFCEYLDTKPRKTPIWFALSEDRHRLAPDDFTATLLEKGGWFHLSLPLIEVDELTYTDRSGRDFWTRRPGDLLSPGWTTAQAVADIRRRLPKEIFEGQYQQNPQFGGSGICSIDRLARFEERSHYELIVHCWDLAGTKSGGDWTVCAKFGLTRDQERREVFDLLEIIRVRIELPDVRELIRNQDRIDKPALLIVDGVGIGRAIVQELSREMRHLLPGGSFDDQNVSGLKVRRFHNAMPAMYDGLVRLPTTMPGLETLLAEFAAFPDGRNDDQVDAVCNVAANRELIIRRARLFGERLGRIRPIPRVVPPTPPKSRDQELYDRRRQFRD